jgi:hypothetical protein
VGAESAPVLQARGEVSHIIRQISNGAFQFHYAKLQNDRSMNPPNRICCIAACALAAPLRAGHAGRARG